MINTEAMERVCKWAGDFERVNVHMNVDTIGIFVHGDIDFYLAQDGGFVVRAGVATIYFTAKDVVDALDNSAKGGDKAIFLKGV